MTVDSQPQQVVTLSLGAVEAGTAAVERAARADVAQVTPHTACCGAEKGSQSLVRYMGQDDIGVYEDLVRHTVMVMADT